MNADVGIDVYGCVVPAGILNNFLIHFIFWYGVTVSVSDEFKYYGSTESTKKHAKLICKMFTVAIDKSNEKDF